MVEALLVAAPLALGIAGATPREHAPAAALLLAVLGAASGAVGLALAHEGRIEEALAVDVASVLFDILSILKALEAM